MDFCPICKYHSIYLDIDAPHIIRCLLKYAIDVRFTGQRWWRWINPNALLEPTSAVSWFA